MNISDFEDLIFEQDNEFSVSWVIGGQTGGSCWDTGDKDTHTSIEAEEEPEFSDLENFLENFPDLKYSTYKKIKNIIKFKDIMNKEYYGNYEESRKKYIILSELKNILIEDNCFDNCNTLKV